MKTLRETLIKKHPWLDNVQDLDSIVAIVEEYFKEKDTVELPEEMDPFMIQSSKDAWRMAEVINQIIKWGHSIE